MTQLSQFPGKSWRDDGVDLAEGTEQNGTLILNPPSKIGDPLAGKGPPFLN